MGLYLDEYITSSFGVNVGTGLMLESIIKPIDDRIDDTRTIPNKVNIKDYELYYINIHSLVTNIVSSYSSNSVDELLRKNKDMIDMVLERTISEMVMIKEMLDVELIYYNMLYGPYHRKKLIKESTNVDSKAYKLKKSIDELIVKLLTSSEVKIEEVDTNLPKRKKSLISTSNSIDLLNSNKMDLELLEFHTGVLKKRDKFYTKLNTKVELPFEELLLFALVDKKGLINPVLSIKERRILVDAIISKRLKPYNRYSRGFIYEIIKDDTILSKLKSIPSVY